MDAAKNDFWIALQHLWEVPTVLLSTKGIAQGTGFAALAYVRGMIQPPVQRALDGMPLAQLTTPIWSGMWTNANFIYGLRSHA